MIKNAGRDSSNTMHYLVVMFLVMIIFLGSFDTLPYIVDKGLLWQMVIKRIKHENPSFSNAVIKIERDGRKETVYIHIFERDESLGSDKERF